MILLGVLTYNGLTAVTGSIEQYGGAMEKEIVGTVAADPFEALAVALADCKLSGAKAAKIFTNDAPLLKFLTPPIKIAPTVHKTVKGFGKVGWGGNLNQWGVIYGLFQFDRWQIREAAKLPGTKAVRDEFCESNCYQATVGGSIQGCYRRIYAGVWTDA
jgi:hypothetical protein